jgi:hypothetical protein
MSPFPRSPTRIIVFLFGLMVAGSARAEDRVNLTALASWDSHNPARAGGEVSVETDRFPIRNLTCGFMALAPVAHGSDTFDIVNGVQGFEGIWLGWRHRWHGTVSSPFAGISGLSHLALDSSYFAAVPEVGCSLACFRKYEVSCQLRYYVVSRGRENDFFSAGIGMSRLF